MRGDVHSSAHPSARSQPTNQPTPPPQHTEEMKHPFEVTEKGWGEFEALIELNFRVRGA